MKRPTVFLIITRNRIYYIAILMIIISIVAFLSPNVIEKVMSIRKIRPLSNKVIVVDPGHGGIDGGTHHGDVLEKNINLILGLKLKENLIKKGATVVMTREIDDSLDDHKSNGSRHLEDLNARVKIINESNADVFISIHVNHTRNVNKIGPIVFYYENCEESKKLAGYIQDYLNKLNSYKNMEIDIKNSIFQGNYYILKYTTLPGVIIETGFLSNKIDRKLLQDSEHQDEMVELITNSIILYFREND